jgi:hypothetical protein
MTENSDEKMACLGTRMVVLTCEEPDSDRPKEGLLAVYSYQGVSEEEEESSQSSDLEIRVGTSSSTFSGIILLDQVKLPDKAQLSNYFLQDEREHPDISIRFQHDDDDDSGNLKIVIQQRLASTGLRKFAYSGVLRKSGSCILDFGQRLGQAVNQSRASIKILHQQLAQKQQAAEHWKDTAEKLDQQVWQKEKDQLLNNFLKLWNERQRRAKQELKELQDELDLTKAAMTTSKKRPRRALQLLDDDAQDDLAASKEPLPLDEVAALAAGHKTQPTRKTSILNPAETLSAATLKQQAKDYKKKKNTVLDEKKKTRPSAKSSEAEIKPRKKRAMRVEELPSEDKDDDEKIMEENSEDEAMRRAIRASVMYKSAGEDDKSDASF